MNAVIKISNDKKKVFEKKFENGSKTILLDLNLMQKKLINLQ